MQEQNWVYVQSFPMQASWGKGDISDKERAAFKEDQLMKLEQGHETR